MLVFQSYFELDKNVKISFPIFYNCGNLVDTFTFNEIAKLFFNVRWSEICFIFSKLNFPMVLHQRNHNIGPMNHVKFTHVSPKMCLRLLKMHPCGVFSTSQYHCLLPFNARRCNYSNSCKLQLPFVSRIKSFWDALSYSVNQYIFIALQFLIIYMKITTTH